MRNHRGMKRLFMFGLVLTMLIPVLAACTKQAPASDDTVRTLRFASSNGYTGTNGEYFREYTELFEYEYKNIQLEYIQTVDQGRYYYGTITEEEQVDPLEALKEAMTGPTPPDVIMVDYNHLPELINENLLVSLDELIMKESTFNVDSFVPAVIDGLRKPGNGTLYALAPMFYSSAVIYNKQHFLNKGVEFPTDNMTWQEMFDLARRVTVQDDQNPVYGFSFNNYEGGIGDLYYNMQVYTQPLGMRWIDVDTLQMTANTPLWQEVWTTFVDLYKEKVLPQEPDYSQPRTGPFDWDVFLSGKTAMAIVPYNYLFQVVEANKNADRIENYEAIDWDVVTLPTHEAAPGIGSNVYYQGIFAINANAENLDDAWEFIKFITGEDFARIKSKSNNYLLARQDYIKPIDGVEYNLNAFMALSPPEYSSADQELYEKLPDYCSVQNIGQQKLYEVLREGKDVQLALQEWEAEGQMMIEQLLEQRENGGDGNVGIFGLTEEKLRLLEASGELINITTTEATAEEVAE